MSYSTWSHVYMILSFLEVHVRVVLCWALCCTSCNGRSEYYHEPGIITLLPHKADCLLPINWFHFWMHPTKLYGDEPDLTIIQPRVPSHFNHRRSAGRLLNSVMVSFTSVRRVLDWLKMSDCHVAFKLCCGITSVLHGPDIMNGELPVHTH